MNKDNLSRRAYLLHLNAMSLANGMRSGTFKSLYRGQGVEFNGVSLNSKTDGLSLKALATI